MFLDALGFADMPVYRIPDETKRDHLNRTQAWEYRYLHWRNTPKDLLLNFPGDIPWARAWIEIQCVTDMRDTLDRLYINTKGPGYRRRPVDGPEYLLTLPPDVQ